MSARVFYLYGFVSRGTDPPSPEIEGIDGSAVEVHPLGSFDAAVSRVPASAYDSEVVEKRLRDLDWVAAQGAAHERVVTWFVDRSCILPARLFTLYRSLRSLEAEAGEREDWILTSLDRFRGLHEWDLKISYDEKALSQNLGELSADVGSLEEEMQAATPGRRYLLGRARGARAREESGRVARALAEELVGSLDDLAERRVRIPLPRELDDARVVSNVALLVSNARRTELLSRVDEETGRLEAKGLRVEFSGPWAPYRFLEAEASE